jgi:hypothetical protein
MEAPSPTSSYSKVIGVYFPLKERLRRETVSYHDPNRLWNPSCLIIKIFVRFDKVVWFNKPRILSVFLRKNAKSYKNFKMLQLLTNINNYKRSSFKLQNTVYVSDRNIIAFQAFVVSCFGQWRMSLHVENLYRELNHTFLVPDTLQSYSSLWLSCTEIVNWFTDQLV